MKMSSESEHGSTGPTAPAAAAATTEGAGAVDSDNAKTTIRVNIPPRILLLTGMCGVTGLSLGLIRGSRKEGMRFLAENAHRPPTTIRGWYLYKKTKNYRMMWGGLKEGGREATRLGAIGASFALAEEGMSRVGLGEAREAGAGVITAVLVCAAYRLPWVNTRRAVLLGGVVGGMMSMLRRLQGRLIATREEEDRKRDLSGDKSIKK